VKIVQKKSRKEAVDEAQKKMFTKKRKRKKIKETRRKEKKT
jgi:hypothetical protein